jgi:hypothetical protein
MGKRRIVRFGKAGAVWAWRILAITGTLIGISGIPGDLETWTRWIDSAVNDPFVLNLANQAVAVAEFVNNPWVRTALVIGGLLMLIWPLRWFWRIRHRLAFAWRRAVKEPVWIAYDEAHRLVRASPWGSSRRAKARKAKSFLDAIAFRPDPAERERDRMFVNWCKLALDRFGSENTDSIRVVDNKKEIDEVKLSEWLRNQYEQDIIDEFGDP